VSSKHEFDYQIRYNNPRTEIDNTSISCVMLEKADIMLF